MAIVDRVIRSFIVSALKYLFKRPSSGCVPQLFRTLKRRIIPITEQVFLVILPPFCSLIFSFSKFYFFFKQKSKPKKTRLLKKNPGIQRPIRRVFFYYEIRMQETKIIFVKPRFKHAKKKLNLCISRINKKFYIFDLRLAFCRLTFGYLNS